FGVAINTMGSWRRMALALGADSVDDVAHELGSLIQAKPPIGLRQVLSLLRQALDLRHARPKVVSDGPCKEVIHKFDAPPTRTDPWPTAPDVKELGTRNSELGTLLNLPIQQCWPLDGGRFIPLTCVVTKAHTT